MWIIKCFHSIQIQIWTLDISHIYILFIINSLMAAFSIEHWIHEWHREKREESNEKKRDENENIIFRILLYIYVFIWGDYDQLFGCPFITHHIYEKNWWWIIIRRLWYSYSQFFIHFSAPILCFFSLMLLFVGIFFSLFLLQQTIGEK